MLTIIIQYLQIVSIANLCDITGSCYYNCKNTFLRTDMQTIEEVPCRPVSNLLMKAYTSPKDMLEDYGEELKYTVYRITHF